MECIDGCIDVAQPPCERKVAFALAAAPVVDGKNCCALLFGDPIGERVMGLTSSSCADGQRGKSVTEHKARGSARSVPFGQCEVRLES